jgi:transcriptional regulator with XRE-family HTH domain
VSEQRRPLTLKEFRELRGMSVEELADESGVPAQMIERWEGVGMDAAPITRKADFFAYHQLAALGEVLGFDRVKVPFAASEAEPGDMVITAFRPSERLERLVQEALDTEGVNVRIAVPTERWGVVLKSADEVTPEERQAIDSYEAEEAAHNEERLRVLGAILTLMEGRDEDVTVEEALEQADQELSADLDRLQEDEQDEEPGTT